MQFTEKSQEFVYYKTTKNITWRRTWKLAKGLSSPRPNKSDLHYNFSREQNKTKQNKTKQNKTKQRNKTKQNKQTKKKTKNKTKQTKKQTNKQTNILHFDKNSCYEQNTKMIIKYLRSVKLKNLYKNFLKRNHIPCKEKKIVKFTVKYGHPIYPPTTVKSTVIS